MFNHIKIIGLSVGLLVILSGLTSVSFAIAWRDEAKPQNAASAAGLQSAQARMVTGTMLESIAP
jgi:hypothetical protein